MRNRLRLLVIIIALAIMTFFALKNIFRDSQSSLENTKAEYVISAANLVAAFDENEAAASKLYVNTVIEVNGTLEFKQSDEWGQVMLTLVDPLQGLTAIIDSLGAQQHRNLIENLEPGDEVTLKGRCDGYLDEVRLSKCWIIKVGN